jgi:cobalt/nickel transport system permease protein
MVIVFAAATRFADVMAALRKLGIPGLLVSIITLMWRYLFVIIDEVTRLMRARSSRSAAAPAGERSGGSLWWRGRVTGGMAGSLFLRSLERSDRVYAAMLARGYNGELPAENAGALSNKEWLVLGLGLLLLLALFLIGFLSGG